MDYTKLINELREAATVPSNGRVAKILYDAANAVSHLKDCRNELCLICGGYKSGEKCETCRWKGVL